MPLDVVAMMLQQIRTSRRQLSVYIEAGAKTTSVDLGSSVDVQHSLKKDQRTAVLCCAPADTACVCSELERQ